MQVLVTTSILMIVLNLVLMATVIWHLRRDMNSWWARHERLMRRRGMQAERTPEWEEQIRRQRRMLRFTLVACMLLLVWQLWRTWSWIGVA